MLKPAQVLLADAKIEEPGLPGVDPVLEPLFIGAGLDEELQLHLLELAGPEDEVARCDLVPEGLADLADAERDLLARGLNDVLVVDEDALGSLRTQVGQPGLVLGGAEIGAEH